MDVGTAFLKTAGSSRRRAGLGVSGTGVEEDGEPTLAKPFLAAPEISLTRVGLGVRMYRASARKAAAAAKAASSPTAGLDRKDFHAHKGVTAPDEC
jgi:hypothetical protein